MINQQKSSLGRLFGVSDFACNPEEIESIHLFHMGEDTEAQLRGFAGFSEVYIAAAAVVRAVNTYREQLPSEDDQQKLMAKMWLSALIIHESSHVYARRHFNDLNMSTPTRRQENAASSGSTDDAHRNESGQFVEKEFFGIRRDWLKMGLRLRGSIIDYARAFVTAIEEGAPVLPVCTLPEEAATGPRCLTMALSFVPSGIVFM